jgi:hypothetical protein
MSGTTILHSLNDRKIGVTRLGNLAGNDIQITRPCVDATVTVAAENANVRAITIALKDIFGAAINYVETVEIIVFGAADMLSFATTGGSTGIAIGTNGALLTIVAKKLFRATSEADGTIDLTWTDTGTESVAVGVRLPNGRVVVSSAFANT